MLCGSNIWLFSENQEDLPKLEILISTIAFSLLISFISIVVHMWENWEYLNKQFPTTVMVLGETYPATQIDPCHQMINGGLLCLFLTKLLLGKKKFTGISHWGRGVGMEEHEDDGCYRNGHLENWRKRERESLISHREMKWIPSIS